VLPFFAFNATRPLLDKDKISINTPKKEDAQILYLITVICQCDLTASGFGPKAKEPLASQWLVKTGMQEGMQVAGSGVRRSKRLNPNPKSTKPPEHVR